MQPSYVDVPTLLERYLHAMKASNFGTAARVVDALVQIAENDAEQAMKSDGITAGYYREQLRDWHGAEAAYLAVISSTDQPLYTVHQAHSKLYELYMLLGDYYRADKHSWLDLRVAQQLDLVPPIVRCLQREARCCIRRGEVDRAHAAIAEAMSLISVDDSAMEQLAASTFVARSECWLATGVLSRAKADLQSASKSLSSLMLQGELPGVLLDARWLCVAYGNAAILESSTKDSITWYTFAVDIGRSLNRRRGDVFNQLQLVFHLGQLCQLYADCEHQGLRTELLGERQLLLAGLKLPSVAADVIQANM
jgi:hypothetical protein